MFKNSYLLYFLIGFTPCINSLAGNGHISEILRKEIAMVVGQNFISNDLTSLNERSLQVQSGKFFSISTANPDKPAMYVYFGKVNTCRAGGCSKENVHSSDSYSEFFEYYIFFDPTGTITQVKVLNYQATHGHEITSKNWLKQFNKYNGEKSLLPGKNVDAISGATTSVDAITLDIENQTKYLKNWITTQK